MSGVRMTGADAILRCLEAEGVEVCSDPRRGDPPTYDAIARGTTVRHVLARHEQGAGHMAQGYARASGDVGVVLATSGPGATHLVTAIADAAMDSTPLVCVTGQVRSHLIGTDAFQECDIVGVTAPIVKHAWLVRDVREPAGVSSGAPFHLARTGRRQARCSWTSPRDVQESQIEFPLSRRGRPAGLGATRRAQSARGHAGGGGNPRGAPAGPLRRGRRSRSKSAP